MLVQIIHDTFTGQVSSCWSFQVLAEVIFKWQVLHGKNLLPMWCFPVVNFTLYFQKKTHAGVLHSAALWYHGTLMCWYKLCSVAFSSSDDRKQLYPTKSQFQIGQINLHNKYLMTIWMKSSLRLEQSRSLTASQEFVSLCLFSLGAPKLGRSEVSWIIKEVISSSVSWVLSQRWS